MATTNLPLSHLKVLDLSRVRAGPTAVRQLSDWGADVIMVESPDDGGFIFDRNGSDYLNLHRNKRSITLDLKKPHGMEVLTKLVQETDIFIENFRPDVKFRLGIDYESLKKINPRLIYASISGFGQTGPYAKRPGLDQIAQGMGGMMSINGHPNSEPLRVGIPIDDLCAGLFAAMGILVAAMERERSGEGQYVETSLLATQLFMLDFQAARWLMDGEVPEPAGNFHPLDNRTGVFRTADGFLNLGIWGNGLWKRFCDAIDAPGLVSESAAATGPDRATDRARFTAQVESYLTKKTSAEWLEVLNNVGVPCGPIYRMDEVFSDPQVCHLDIVKQMDTKERGTVNVVGQPWTLSRTPSVVRSGPPARGEHNDEVLQSLGFSNEQIEEFKVDGTI